MNFSEVIALPGGEITLVMTLNQISDPKAVPAKAPRLRIPENTKDFYIILTDDPENQEIPVRMNLVSADNGKLKVGETLWFNLTGHRIVAKLGDTDMSVDPNGKTVSKSPVSASSYYAARFAYQADGKGPLAPITEQNWWHDVASRHMGFIAYTGGKLPKIYFYRDYRDPLAEKQSVEVVQEPSPP